MPHVEFESAVSASERPQTYALDRAATGTGILVLGTYNVLNKKLSRRNHHFK
jgi:hypothetical protein